MKQWKNEYIFFYLSYQQNEFAQVWVKIINIHIFKAIFCATYYKVNIPMAILYAFKYLAFVLFAYGTRTFMLIKSI